MIVIAISGKQGVGKSTIVHKLTDHFSSKNFKVYYRRFAQPLYEMHDVCMKIMKNYGYDFGKKNGPFLQLIGTEWGRNTVDKNIWVNCLSNWIQQIETTNDMFLKDTVVLVDDMRFKNEMEMFNNLVSPERKVLLVRLECPEEIRKTRAESWREATTHASEIDLDDCIHKFDLVLNNVNQDDLNNNINSILEKVLS